MCLAAVSMQEFDRHKEHFTSYVDGFVIAVPTASKQKLIAHADKGDGLFMDHGATRVVECWGADVHKGEITDFRGAAAAEDGETVVFSWIARPR
jgi:uncharacterized protein YbaA (DUF1428 family)